MLAQRSTGGREKGGRKEDRRERVVHSACVEMNETREVQ